MQKLIRNVIGFVAFGMSTFAGLAWAAETPAARDPMAKAVAEQTAAAPAVSVPAEKAKPTTVKETQPAMSASDVAAGKSEKTEHNFEDLLVQGKYHFSDEAVTTVEEDKVLDSLLGVRTDFKDKIEQSVGRY